MRGRHAILHARRRPYFGRHLSRRDLDPPPRRFRPALERFLALVDRESDPEGHWLWRGFRNRDGAPVFRTWRGTELARRVSFVLFVAEEIPAGVRVTGCDHGACVRPEHLELNRPRPRSKLTPADVRRLRADRQQGARLAVLAERYRISERYAYRVARGECRREVA